jgi:hypothetical protein
MTKTHDIKQTAMHTPGPWDTGFISQAGMPYIGNENEAVCQVAVGPRTEANARLIAAAPEVTESGRLLLHALDEKNEAAIAFHMEGLRASIAKATVDRRSI